MTVSYDELEQNIARIKAEIGPRARILAATKTQSPEVINFTINHGIDLIGENRVQELLAKYDAIDKSKCEIHFIGRLQTNKVKYIVDKVTMIHSVDSLHLAAEIDKRCAAIGKTMDILAEVNLGSEESKGGVELSQVDDFVSNLSRFEHLRLRGLMGVAPKCDLSQKNALLFKKLSQKLIDISHLKVDNGNIDVLSAGMSGDYLTAVECGSNLVRLGSALYGARQ